MSEKIDWSKAPEWAKKHGLSGAFKSPVWFDDKKYTYVDGQQDGKEFFYADACTYAAKDFSQVAERPTTPSWSGEGLPPVGVVCEYRVCDGPWYKCEIRYTVKSPDGGVIAYCQHLDHEQALYAPYCCFRPIRTPEQIAADEREAAISEMTQFFMNHYGDPKGAEKYFLVSRSLYDAGFRKP